MIRSISCSASTFARASSLLSRASANGSIFQVRNVFSASATNSSSSLVRSMPSNVRWYTAMTKEEEEEEKIRVSLLSPEEKDQELRKLNREVAKLEMLRGINNGELYTWSGRYKAMVRDYGMPLFVYYWAVWGTMGFGMYAAIGIGGLDAMDVISRFDDFTGWDLASKVDPALGKVGLALVLNEMMEPIRLPFVVATLKPIVEVVSPNKY